MIDGRRVARSSRRLTSFSLVLIDDLFIFLSIDFVIRVFSSPLLVISAVAVDFIHKMIELTDCET